MFKKLIIASVFTLLTHSALADTCPNVTDIKKNTLNGWKAFDDEEGKALSAKRQADYLKNIDEFTMAEWSYDNQRNGTIHCYYRDKDGSNMDAYLSKDHFALSANQKYWYEVSGAKQCAAAMDKCSFDSNVGKSLQHAEFAKK